MWFERLNRLILIMPQLLVFINNKQYFINGFLEKRTWKNAIFNREHRQIGLCGGRCKKQNQQQVFQLPMPQSKPKTFKRLARNALYLVFMPSDKQQIANNLWHSDCASAKF